MQNADNSKTENFFAQYMDGWNQMVRAGMAAQVGGEQPPMPNFNFDPAPLLQQLGKTAKKASQANNSAQAQLQEQLTALQQQVQLWQSMASSMTFATEPLPMISEDPDDRRFSDPQWNSNPLYSYIKQSYLLNSRMLTNIVEHMGFDDERAAERAKFIIRQYISALAPTNNALTNPEVQAQTLATNGQNLVKGMENFTRDVQRSPMEVLKIAQSEPGAFELGKTLANTRGKVIFQNEIMQLIQYAPSTEQVYSTPILFVPPIINKFYILDLNKTKSMMRWLVAEGFTVFMISWVNPDASLAWVGFDDYIVKGIFQSLDIVTEVCKTKQVAAAGYCSGGTLLAIAQSMLRARGDSRIICCSLIATQTDFSDPGSLGVYLSDDLIPYMEQHTNMKGIFDGRILATGFNLLRENSLYWSYFVDNYLKGNQPKAFDILHWNNDSTNIPARAMSFYLRKMYMENSLTEAGALVIDGQEIDISWIDTPTYFIATRSDHLVPCTACYRSSKYFSGPVRFVLGESGHIAGIVNPVDTGKYNHWVNDKPSPDFEAWQRGASEVKGSWWSDWANWLKPQAGKQVKARKVGSPDYPALESAPGSYVKVCI